MKIELIGRFTHKSDEPQEETEEERVQRIINSDFIPTKRNRYVYDPFVIELEDIKTIIRLDDSHTQVNTYDNDTFIIKQTYNIFKSVYEQFTGKLIINIDIKE